MVAGSVSAALLTSLPQLLRPAESPQVAVERIAAAVRKSAIPSLWRVSLRRLLLEEDSAEIVAVWSAAPTALEPGVRMSLVATGIPELLAARRPTFRNENDDNRMLDGILSSEGVASWVTIPLSKQEMLRAVLTLSSFEPEGVMVEDREFYASLGQAVEERLVALLDEELGT